MTDLPPPLVPEGCDVRGLAWMPLYGRAFGSRFYSLALRDPRAGIAAIKLWWEAWQQCPAGSLPDDDFDLARMADFGTDARGWAKAKATALHGFVRCNDGRLYHPVICAEAMEAWDRRRKERDRKAGQRARKSEVVQADVLGLSRGTGAGQGDGLGAAVRADSTRQDKTGQREGKDNVILGVSFAAPVGRRRDRQAEAPGFAEFWDAYPKPVSKGHARKAWEAAVRKASPEQIIEGVRKARWNPNPKYIPHPATWLTGEKWADEADNRDPVLVAAMNAARGLAAGGGEWK